MKTKIYLVGKCNNPDCKEPVKTKLIGAVIDDSELEPSPCSDCSGTVTWTHFEVHHKPQKAKKKVRWGLFTLAALFTTGMIFGVYAYYNLNKGYSWNEVSAAQKAILNKPSSQILKELPGSIRYKAMLLHADRNTIRRLQDGITKPSPICDFAIKGLRIDYELLRRNPFLFRIRYYHPYELYAAIPDPALEIWQD